MEILQRISSYLTIIGTLMVCCGCFIPYVDSISCYRCDALDQKKTDCPGWMRRPINSVLDLHDRGGLYTHCIDVRLANGTVLHQDVVPTLPFCKASFIQTWHDSLVKRYEMEVSIICCEWNRCNGPNARAAFGTKYGGSNSKLVWSLPILVITVITWWTQLNLAIDNTLSSNQAEEATEEVEKCYYSTSFLQKCRNQIFTNNCMNINNKTILAKAQQQQR